MNLYQWLIDNGHEGKLPEKRGEGWDYGDYNEGKIYNEAINAMIDALKQIEFNSREMIDMQTGLRHDVVILGGKK